MPSKYLLRFGGSFERGLAAGVAKLGVCRDLYLYERTTNTGS